MMRPETALVEKRAELTAKILGLQDENGCWNVLRPGDRYYPDCQYYCPNYRSTLWTMVFLADIGCKTGNGLEKPFGLMSEHFYDEENRIYTIGRSHFPIPCLNGNMLYLHSYFGIGDQSRINSIIDFFCDYQRFDDGGYRTPSSHPYYYNRSCYGSHSCYWGVVKLLKGLSFLPKKQRTENAESLITRCIDFILLHEVCFSSHKKTDFIHPSIGKLAIPNMYRGDFLEILWLLMREGIRDKRVERALKLLESKRLPDGGWKPERMTAGLVVPFGSRTGSGDFISTRAEKVLRFYHGA